MLHVIELASSETLRTLQDMLPIATVPEHQSQTCRTACSAYEHPAKQKIPQHWCCSSCIQGLILWGDGLPNGHNSPSYLHGKGILLVAIRSIS